MKIKIEAVLDHLSHDLRAALRDAAYHCGAEIDEKELFKDFVKAVGRKCSTWVTVPDRLVDHR